MALRLAAGGRLREIWNRACLSVLLLAAAAVSINANQSDCHGLQAFHKELHCSVGKTGWSANVNLNIGERICYAIKLHGIKSTEGRTYKVQAIRQAHVLGPSRPHQTFILLCRKP